MELVLALDASASVDGEEFRLQIDGLAAAFANPLVLREIEDLKPGGAVIAVVQWGGPGQSRLVLPPTLIVTSRDAKAFGFRASLIRRWLYGSSTSIADGIGFSQDIIEHSPYQALRAVIDVSGDGQDNGGGDLLGARARAKAAGITINGLAIMADESDLAEYYRGQVIAGSFAFVEPARDFEDFARAIAEKLQRELRPPET